MLNFLRSRQMQPQAVTSMSQSCRGWCGSCKLLLRVPREIHSPALVADRAKGKRLTRRAKEAPERAAVKANRQCLVAAPGGCENNLAARPLISSNSSGVTLYRPDMRSTRTLNSMSRPPLERTPTVNS